MNECGIAIVSIDSDLDIVVTFAPGADWSLLEPLLPKQKQEEQQPTSPVGKSFPTGLVPLDDDQAFFRQRGRNVNGTASTIGFEPHSAVF